MRKIIALLLSIIIVVSLSACAKDSVNKTKNQMKDLISSQFDSDIKESIGYKVIAENNILSLAVNGADARICVTDKRSGAKWFSNPENSEEDVLAKGEGKTQLMSQLMITYIDSEDKSLYLNSYDDCVLQKQFAYYEIENGIRILYNIGEIKKEYIIPNVISKERFESCIKEKMTGEEFYKIEPFYILQTKADFSEDLYEEFRKKYPTIDKGDIYTLSEDLPDYVLEDIEKVISATGYSKEDKVRDDTENMYKAESDGIYFQIPVEYVIENDNLIARVVNDEIAYSDNIMFNELTFLPSFGAVHSSSEGYMFVPDGSGAIIECNNGKASYPQYKQPVYGNDIVNLDKKEAPNNKTQIYMPVFGIKNKQNAFIAIIEEGCAQANVCAQVSGHSNSYNMCYSTFFIRPKSQINLTFNEDKGLYVYPSEDLNENIQIKYHFLNREKADYNGMAVAYREYLSQKSKLPENVLNQSPSFGIELVGSVRHDALFLGVPMETNKILTSYSQAADIIGKLRNNGIENIEFSYLNTANGGQYSKEPSGISLISKFGNRKQLQRLFDAVKSHYIQIEMQKIYSDTLFDGFSKNKDSAKSFSTEAGLMYEYNPATLSFEKSALLISPRFFKKYSEKIANSAKKLKISGIDMKDFGKALYSDNGKECLNRGEVIKKTVEALEIISKNAGLRFNSPNDYAWKYTSSAAQLPCGSDEYYLFDYDIPFYQMVTHGYFNCYSEPLNLADDYSEALLRSAAYGMNMNYRWIYEPNYEMKDTKTAYHSLNYIAWFDRAVKDYSYYSNVFDGLNNKRITEFNRLSDNITETVYENGAKVFVNFGESDETIGKISIPAGSYLCIREGE